MKSNEYRIGNIIDSDRGIGVISELSEYKSNVGIRTNEFKHFAYINATISRVTLTHKWLLDFGFEKDGVQYSKAGVIILYEKRFFKFYYGVGMGDFKNLNYVHQLQNLFYCLTGEELQVVANDR